jgi:RNA polymerase sigma-70 factor (ECF subfamily)
MWPHLDESTFPDFRDRFLAREVAAFTEFVRVFECPLLNGIARRFPLQGTTIPEDAVQETFTIVWRYALRGTLPRIESWRDFWRLLWLIAYRRACIAYRRERRNVKLSEQADHIPDTSESADEACERLERLEQVNGEIENLPTKEREVILMRYRGELSPRQIAERLGCPVGTIRSRLCRATSRLRRQLNLPVDAAEPEPQSDRPDTAAADAAEPQTQIEGSE